MVVPPLFDAVIDLLRREPDVRAVTVFGSHARQIQDAESDIDLQIVTRKPLRFRTAQWLEPLQRPLEVYAWRPAFGGVLKATAVFTGGGELDVVAIPFHRLRLARWLVSMGAHRRSRRVARALGHLTIVLRPGHAVVHGGSEWERFFSRVIQEVPDPRLDDEEVERMAACAYADYRSVQHKLVRGELVAAQRWLHLHLVEVCLKLSHEQRVRSGLPSYHDARRAETTLSAPELARVKVDARLAEPELRAAAEATIVSIARLVKELTGQSPGWCAPEPPDANSCSRVSA